MLIHSKISLDAETDVLVVESNSDSWQYGRPVMLRLVKFPAGETYTTARHPQAEVLESYKVDARYSGPKSAYGRTLNALLHDVAAMRIAAERAELYKTVDAVLASNAGASAARSPARVRL